MQIDVYENTIEYTKMDTPMYSSQYALNSDKLKLDVIVTPKDSFSDYVTMEFVLSDCINDSVIGCKKETNKYILSDLTVSKAYAFNIKLAKSNSIIEMAGEFAVNVEIDNSIVLDLLYSRVENQTTQQSRIAPINEFEPNNTQNQADLLSNGVSTIGKFTTSADVDYFYYDVPQSVPGGVVNLDISVSVPTGTKTTMRVYCTAAGYNTTIASTTGCGRNLHINNALSGGRYYVKLTQSYGSSNSNYYITVNQAIGKAWYSQKIASIGSVDYWNPNKLNTLTITKGSEALKCFLNNGSANITTYWFGTGCGVASAAMALRNMNKTMYGYDFRTNYTGQMMADPFTAMLANCNINGTTMNANTTSLTVSVGPNYFTSSNIKNKFGVNKKCKSENTLTCVNETQLRELIDQYGSVLVYLRGSTWNHFMVFTGYNTTGSTFARRFRVYDSCSTSYSTGANVLLSNTTSGYSTKTFSDILDIVVFY